MNPAAASRPGLFLPDGPLPAADAPTDDPTHDPAVAALHARPPAGGPRLRRTGWFTSVGP